MAAMLLLAGCTTNGGATPNGNEGNVSPKANVTNTAGNLTSAAGNKTNVAKVAENMTENVSKAKNPIVVFETEKGTFKAEIFEKDAPITAGNFLSLVKEGFYNNLTFHRVVPNFVTQGGDPKGDGTGGSKKTIPLEVKSNLRHEYGSLGMARSSAPDSASSQFYVVTGPADFLDGQYAVFGRVTNVAGMNVVLGLKVGDRMSKVYIEG